MIDINVRKGAAGERLLFLIGPGGVGKSTLGRLLAPALGRRLIDLDNEFCERIAPIGTYVREVGPTSYAHANSALALNLASKAVAPSVFVTSSGFLSVENPLGVQQANSNLLRSGYAISVLPSVDLIEASCIVIKRQLGRGFGLKREIEEQKFSRRFPIYLTRGDMLLLASQIDGRTVAALLGDLQSMIAPKAVSPDGE